jgi:hypothetical protein
VKWDSIANCCEWVVDSFHARPAITPDGPAPAQFTILHSDRTELGDGITHYRYDVAMGPGKYDVVRIHRIVREKRPNKPVSTRDAVMLLPGDPNSFQERFCLGTSGVDREYGEQVRGLRSGNAIRGNCGCQCLGVGVGWIEVPGSSGVACDA